MDIDPKPNPRHILHSSKPYRQPYTSHGSGFVVNDEDGAARGDFLAVFRRSAVRNLPRVAPPPRIFDFERTLSW
jgi:hypothetical protein